MKNQQFPTLEELSTKCAQWNAENPPGTPVNVRMDSGEIRETWTRTQASVLSGHTAVIWLEGISGAYLLERVTRRPAVDKFKEQRQMLTFNPSPDTKWTPPRLILKPLINPDAWGIYIAGPVFSPFICEIAGHRCNREDIARFARLFTAAPLLYAALKEVLARFDPITCPQYIGEAFAALAAAESPALPQEPQK